MGGSQSTRNITVSNENADVIRLSDGVVRRLRGEAEAAAAQATPEINPQASGRAMEPPRAYIPGYNPISTIQVRKEVQAANEQLEKHWAKRVSSLVEEQEKSRQIMESEFRKSLMNVQIAFKGYNSERYENPCLELEASLTKCYTENTSQPLNCGEQVRAFAECVQVKHSNMMKART